jgi:predicted TIM-barrel fold metal-dependent hydrolase
MEWEDLADYYRSRHARAVLLGWDSESTNNRRPFSSRDVASLVEFAPDVFVGLGAVDPSKGAAAVAQVHEAARMGLAGISLYPPTQGRSPSERTTNPVWEAAAGHDLICMFHTGSTLFGAGMPGGAGVRLEPARPLHVDSVAARLPELRIVLAHGGTLWLSEALAVAVHKSNVFLCLGGQSPAALGGEVIDAINGPLSDRVIFGSGFPFAEPDDWIEKWGRLDLGEATTRKVLHDNALALIGSSTDS